MAFDNKQFILRQSMQDRLPRLLTNFLENFPINLSCRNSLFRIGKLGYEDFSFESPNDY